MLKRYSISNFKIFEGENNFDLGKITLIYGPNSSGKSSLIQSLILLKESLLSKDIYLKTNNTYFNLGNFNTIVTNHNNAQDICFKLFFDNNQASEFKYSFNQEERKAFLSEINSTIDTKKYKFSLSDNFLNQLTNTRNEFNLDDKNEFIKDKLNELINKKNKELKDELLNRKDNYQNLLNLIKKEKIEKNNEIEGFISNFISEMKSLENKIEEFKKIDLTTFFGKNNIIIGTKRFSKTIIPTIDLVIKGSNKNKLINEFLQPDMRKLMFFLNRQLNAQEVKLNKLCESISYIGPLRPHPKRVYLGKNNVDTVGADGENFIEILSEKIHIQTKINKYFQKMKIGYELQVTNNGNTIIGDSISILLKDTKTKIEATLVDVGFGIGQILPILVEGVFKKNSIICVEQPEIHLHPRLQAEFANFFIENIEENSNQWIIETHSEALLLRFQRLVKYGHLNKEDLKIIYIDNNLDCQKILEINIDDDGDFLTEWPEGFFEERMNELYGGDPLGGNVN